MNKISDKDIAVYALYLLDGVLHAVHLERIALKCYELAKKRFSFELPEYEQYPDKHAVYYALDGASKDRCDALVKKSGKRGNGGLRFRITENGVKWVKENESRVVRELKIASSVAPRQVVQRTQRKLREAKNEAGFIKFRNGEMSNVSVYDLVDFLGCSFETSPSAVRDKFAQMKANAALVKDDDVAAFLRACEGQFPKLLQTGEVF